MILLLLRWSPVVLDIQRRFGRRTDAKLDRPEAFALVQGAGGVASFKYSKEITFLYSKTSGF